MSLTKKRTYKEFVKERFLKLFLPLITCILVIAPILSFYADKFHNGYVGNFFEHYYVFFTRYTDLTGYDGGWTPAHLWFLLYLFCFSLIGVLIIALQRRFFQKLNSEPFKEKPMITRVIFLYSLALFPIILNPIIDVLSYFSLFLIGYYVISKKSIMDCIVKFRFLHLIILIIVSAIDVYMFIWIESSNSIINSVFMSLTCWFGILTVLGISKTYFNQKNKLTTYLSSRSFLFYIFHFIWLVIFGYYISKVTSNIALLFIIPVIASYIITFINIELVIKIPVINFLFGVHSKK